MNKKFAIGSDHAGYHLKQLVLSYIYENKYIYYDFGCHSNETSVDYPIYAHRVCRSIINNEYDMGILICSSGNGMNITANKYNDIRSTLCWNQETTYYARTHNNANVLCLPAKYLNDDLFKMLNLFFNLKFEGGRHQNRINKIIP